jgi:hypothetical protein
MPEISRFELSQCGDASIRLQPRQTKCVFPLRPGCCNRSVRVWCETEYVQTVTVAPRSSPISFKTVAGLVIAQAPQVPQLWSALYHHGRTTFSRGGRDEQRCTVFPASPVDNWPARRWSGLQRTARTRHRYKPARDSRRDLGLGERLARARPVVGLKPGPRY